MIRKQKNTTLLPPVVLSKKSPVHEQSKTCLRAHSYQKLVLEELADSFFFFFFFMLNTHLLSFNSVNSTSNNYIRDAANKMDKLETSCHIFQCFKTSRCTCRYTASFLPVIIYSFLLPLSNAVSWASVPAGLAVLRGTEVAGSPSL